MKVDLIPQKSYQMQGQMTSLREQLVKVEGIGFVFAFYILLKHFSLFLTATFND